MLRWWMPSRATWMRQGPSLSLSSAISHETTRKNAASAGVWLSIFVNGLLCCFGMGLAYAYLGHDIEGTDHADHRAEEAE